MPPDNELLVVQHPSDAAQPNAEHVFVVEEELAALSADDLDEVFRQLSDAKDRFDTRLPVYETYWPRFVYPEAPTPSPSTAVTHLILVYKRLESRLEEVEPKRIVCHESLKNNYRTIVTDVGAAKDVPVTEGANPNKMRGLLSAVFSIALLLVDQVVSQITKRLDGLRDPTGTVFIPNINRFDSMGPIMAAAEYDHEAITVRPTLAWLKLRLAGNDPETKTPVTPIHHFSTLRTMFNALKLGLLDLPLELFISREFEHELKAFLEAEFGVQMERTIEHTATKILANPRALLYRDLFNRVADELECERLVTSSMGGLQLSMLNCARERGLETYYVPHSVVIGYALVPPSETTYFVSGPIDMEHLEQSIQVSDTSNVEPLGRPYLSNLYNRHRRGILSTKQKPRAFGQDVPLHIVVATQPFQWHIREEFIQTILASIEASDVDAVLSIKIHPNEAAEDYAAFENRDDVTVTKKDLHGHILDADLIITINSNVGVESMALGTPCVCINRWSPVIRTRPYALKGPVPIITSTDEFATFLGNHERDELKALATAQKNFVTAGYKLAEDTGTAIAEYIGAPPDP